MFDSRREVFLGFWAREWTRIHANGRKWEKMGFRAEAQRRGGGGKKLETGNRRPKTRVGSDRRADPRFRRAAPPGGKKDSHRGAEALRGEETGTRASGRWPGTKQQGGCAVGCISSPKGETFREECEPTLPKAARRANRDLGKVEIDCQRQLRRRSRLGNLRINRAGASEATHKDISRAEQDAEGGWCPRMTGM